MTVSTNSFKECLLLELFIGNKKGFVSSLYRSPSQSQEEFYDFLFLLDQLLSDMVSQNPIFLLVTGDFNARNSSWWKNNCVTREGNKIKSLTCAYGLSQLISDSTHILQNSSSCINVIFTNQLNLVIDFGVHLSLHPNCHIRLYFQKLVILNIGIYG